MSPSRRRAIGAVRGLASRAILLSAPWYGAEALPRMGMTKRRALRGYKGAHGDAPGKTLSVCYLPLRTRITHGHGAMRRDGDIAPYRHYTRALRTQNSHAPHRPRWLTAAVRGMASCAPLGRWGDRTPRPARL